MSESDSRASHQCGNPGRFVVAKSPVTGVQFLNKLIVHPEAPFENGDHVLVNGSYPMVVAYDNSQTLRPNEIGTTAIQRMWMALTMTTSDVSIAPIPPAALKSVLQYIDLEIDFQKKRSESTTTYSADEVAKIFFDIFRDTILVEGQPLIFEIMGQNIKFVVKNVTVMDFNTAPGVGDSSKMGLLVETTVINMQKAEGSSMNFKASVEHPPQTSIFQPNFRIEDMGIGGLDEEFKEIFRRAFASRIFPPSLVKKLGIQHVKGVLLYGPPGTGKTLIARQIGKMLNAREPKIVNGPEILNKYVGASEENIRKLFSDAETEYRLKGDDSGLHIIIFDELDAICKQRGSSNNGTGVGDTIVNQLLSKIDGVDKLNNILIIGMTNRKDMIDEALLRPGRLEVHREIELPDEHGRLQILNIHTAKMRENNLIESDVDLQEIASLTKNFSGAEIEGLVRSATSFAMTRHAKVGKFTEIENAESVRLRIGDFSNALQEMKPMFGTSQEELDQLMQNDIIKFSPIVDEVLNEGRLFIEQVRTSTRTPLVSVLLHGPRGSGKTALAAKIAQASKFPFIRLISPESMLGLGSSPSRKLAVIDKAFADSDKSPLSIIIIDDLERLLEWVNIGPNFSNPILQELLTLLHQQPPKGRRRLIVATTSIDLLDTGLPQAFDNEIHVPSISSLPAFENVLKHVSLFEDEKELQSVVQLVSESDFGVDNAHGDSSFGIGIKKLLNIIEMARQDPEHTAMRLTSVVENLVKQRKKPRNEGRYY